MNKKSVILICFVFLTISGCVSGKVPEFTKAPVGFPGDILEKIAVPSGDEIIKATAKLTTTSSDGRYSRKIALLIKVPSFLRVETMPVFGPADFFLSANEKFLKVFFPREGKFYVGRATKENLFLFFKVLLSPGDMVSMLSGLPPQIPRGELSEYVEGGSYRVDIRTAERKLSLWVDPDDYTLTRIEKIDNGRITYRATFSDHVVFDGISYPGRIDIKVDKPEKTSINIRYLDMEILCEKDTVAFDLQTPPGVAIVFTD